MAPGANGFRRLDREAAADLRDRRQQVEGAVGRQGIAIGNLEVAALLDGVTQLGQPGRQVGDAERGGAHVHPAAALAEVEGDADQADGGHGGSYRRQATGYRLDRPGARGQAGACEVLSPVACRLSPHWLVYL